MCSTAEQLLADGYKARTEHRLADAHLAYAEAVDICRREGNQTLLAKSHTRLGGIERDLGETEEALSLYQQAAVIQRELEEPLNLAHTIRHIADILRESDQLEQAAPYYDEALILYRRSPETKSLDLANTLRGIALLKAETGATQDAIELWKESGVLYARLHIEAGVNESEQQIAKLSKS
jgi:tetratricopeptide (TPR) repeat protein